MNKKRIFRRVRSLIKKNKNIFISGHRDLDLDAIGSALGIYNFAKSCGKRAFIILNDTHHESGVKKILDMTKDVSYIKSRDVDKYIDDKSILIVVDVNKKALLQDEKIVDLFSDVVIFDHHDIGEDTITSKEPLILQDSSSTSELVTEFLYYFGENIPSIYATFLLSGITLDTNEFAFKTSSKTHYAASYLIKSGADVSLVNNLLKQNFEEYILRQRVITDAEIINKNIAFAKGNNRVIYRREELAKIADTLLEFNHIETSYVIGKLSDDVVGISGRSIGNVNVSDVLAILGGGGNRYDAACRIEGKSIKEVEAELKKLLGEIS